jgi:hypothetical protein
MMRRGKIRQGLKRKVALTPICFSSIPNHATVSLIIFALIIAEMNQILYVHHLSTLTHMKFRKPNSDF